MRRKKQPQSKGRARLNSLILETARKLNLVHIVKNYGLDTIVKNVLSGMREDLFGESTVIEHVEDSILKFA